MRNISIENFERLKPYWIGDGRNGCSHSGQMENVKNTCSVLYVIWNAYIKGR